MTRAAAMAAGLVVDELIGEPPAAIHPVARFGGLVAAVERATWRDRRSAGAVLTVASVGAAAVAGRLVGPTAVATWVAVAGRQLRTTAAEIQSALDAGDLERARLLLPALVGRDMADLDEKEVARAVVESVAENTVDAVVAPAFWALVGGAPGAFAHRAVNTLDAMVGHRTPRYARYGWASARLDDVAAWVPARMTAALVATVRPGAAGDVFRVVRTDARAHPSPNAGIAEAAFAAALGLRLGGPTIYHGKPELRPHLGSGRPPEPGDIARAARLSRDVTAALALAATALSRWA